MIEMKENRIMHSELVSEKKKITFIEIKTI